jgi:hypothetical protein
LAHPIWLKKFNLIKKCEKYVHWNWSGVIQTQINSLKFQFPFLSFSSSYIVPFFFMFNFFCNSPLEIEMGWFKHELIA